MTTQAKPTARMVIRQVYIRATAVTAFNVPWRIARARPRRVHRGDKTVGCPRAATLWSQLAAAHTRRKGVKGSDPPLPPIEMSFFFTFSCPTNDLVRHFGPYVNKVIKQMNYRTVHPYFYCEWEKHRTRDWHYVYKISLQPIHHYIIMS